MKYFFKLVLYFSYALIRITIVYSQMSDIDSNFETEILLRRQGTIKWGTENEIINLLKELESENLTTFDEDLFNVMNSSSNEKVSDTILVYFTKTKNIKGTNYALSILENRETKNTTNIISAIAYVEVLKIKDAVPFLRDIIESEETRFISSAVRAIGACGSNDDSVALFILDHLENGTISDSLISDCIFALGEIKSEKSVEYLINMAENTDEKASRRMIAIEALGKIADPKSLNPILRLAQDDDANIRLYCYNSLSSFEDKKIETQILYGFRDSYYKIRMVAAKLSGEKKLFGAVPFLIFRTQYDEIQPVKEESIKALGLIGNTDSEIFLSDYFRKKDTSEILKIITAKSLLQINKKEHIQSIIIAYEDAKNKKHKALQSGLANVITKIVDDSLLEFAKYLIISNDIIEKNYALDISIINKFEEMSEQIEILSNEINNPSLALKATKALKEINKK